MLMQADSCKCFRRPLPGVDSSQTRGEILYVLSNWVNLVFRVGTDSERYQHPRVAEAR